MSCIIKPLLKLEKIEHNNIEDNHYGLAGFLDVETTGLNPHSDEVIELAISLFQFIRGTGEITGIVEEYEGLRQPKTRISPGAARIHGLRFNELRGKSLNHQRIKRIIEKAEFLISHNMYFDRNFTKKIFPICDSKPWLCSMRGINWKNKGFSSTALQYLVRSHDIIVNRAHRAGEDVRSAVTLLSLCDYSGKSYLLELIEKMQD